MKHIVLILIIFSFINSPAQDAKEIVKKAFELMKGENSESQMTMKIVRPSWDRTISMKSWTLGTDYSMVLITAPAKEKGQVFLKRKNEMWNWVPSISRMIKLPASMMSQGWMGSDFTNDEIVQEASVVVDYTHTLLGSETLEGYDCNKIKLVPKPDAPVVWGNIIMWISKKEYFQLKTEYYDEDNVLVKTEIASEVKKLGDSLMPTKFEIIPQDTKGNKTILIMDDVKFNVSLQESFFSQQNMKTVR